MTKIPSVEEINGHRIIEDNEIIKVYKGEVVLPISELIKTFTADRTALLTELRDSELLEEKSPDNGDTDYDYINWGHNTLARAIKAHLDELIKSNNV